jgi:hypothetical protein
MKLKTLFLYNRPIKISLCFSTSRHLFRAHQAFFNLPLNKTDLLVSVKNNFIKYILIHQIPVGGQLGGLELSSCVYSGIRKNFFI